MSQTNNEGKNKSNKYSEKLKNYAKSDIIKKCSNCSMCRDVCPIYQIIKKERSYPGGKFRVFRTFVEENLKIKEKFVEIMALCSMCKHCEVVCPLDFSFTEILEELRKEIVTKSNKPYKTQEDFASKVQKDKNPYGESAGERKKWVKGDIREAKRSPYAYFVGCTSSYREVISALNTAIVLSNILEDNFVLLGAEEYCCGSPLIRTGQVDFNLCLESDDKKKTKSHFDVADYISHNVEVLKEKGVRIVIFNCSGCYKTAVKDWPKYYGGNLPFETFHLTEYVAKNLDLVEKKLKNWDKRITYHDPCHLGRYMKIYDAPRKILRAIDGVQLIEMKNSKECAMCCGAGGGLKGGFPEEALEIAKLRIREAENTGAEILATACVFCKRNLRDAAEALNSKITVLNIEDILTQLLV
ncbi:MAG: 4Fe-4S dicluster domain-containing protein [Candidatus Lokiarchaeota archaeon]|nr:4Fe-4S dicluster domain-containing protein [Candidatus Lokiarchaeota archaeon]MBD3338886.1 4Fe-4S dicluster domain-containing protein [Candidatus Lokiarchaeota archaeon]